MSKLTIDLIAQCNNLDGEFTLWGQDGIMPLNKTADVIMDPFSADINRRETLTQLYSRMKRDALGEDLYMHTNELLSNIETGFRKIIDSQNLNIVSDDPDITGLLRLMNVRFEVPGSLLEKICDYLDVCHEYLGIKLFIFINIKSFLSECEIEQLYSHSGYHKHILLLIENKQSKTLNAENVRIIDEDLCEFGFLSDDYL
jgi:CRISPR-associated protein Csn2